MDHPNRLGSINVEMGDGNKIGHIGHNVTYQAPPPPPNAVYQNGRVVGSFESQPISTADPYTISKLFVDGAFDAGSEFEIQGVRLKIEQIEAETSVRSGGRPPLRTLWHAVCRVL